MNSSGAKKKKNGNVGVIIGILLCIVLIPALVVNLTLIVKSFIYPDQVPSFMGYKPFIVLTDSMQPVFSSGDLVLVQVVSPDSLKVDDIIAYREGKAVVTHRVIEIENTADGLGFQTKGDNNNVQDRNAVKEANLEGKYLFRIEKVGHFAMFLQTPLGMGLFIALPLLAFVLYDILRRTVFDRKKNLRTQELEEELKSMREQLAKKSEEE